MLSNGLTVGISNWNGSRKIYGSEYFGSNKDIALICGCASCRASRFISRGGGMTQINDAAVAQLREGEGK